MLNNLNITHASTRSWHCVITDLSIIAFRLVQTNALKMSSHSAEVEQASHDDETHSAEVAAGLRSYDSAVEKTVTATCQSLS